MAKAKTYSIEKGWSKETVWEKRVNYSSQKVITKKTKYWHEQKKKRVDGTELNSVIWKNAGRALGGEEGELRERLVVTRESGKTKRAIRTPLKGKELTGKKEVSDKPAGGRRLRPAKESVQTREKKMHSERPLR